MPLNEREEQQFRQIASQLTTDDPGLSERMDRLSERLAGAGAVTLSVLIVVAGLALLPLAAESGIYALGLIGYVVAAIGTVRTVRMIRQTSWLPRSLVSAAMRPGQKLDIRGARWWKVTLGVALSIAVFMIATGGATDGARPDAVQPAVADTTAPTLSPGFPSGPGTD
jgi:hypothetical protein